MPDYLKILLFLIIAIAFFITVLYIGGWGLRRVCFKIIADLEEAGAFNAKRAVKLQDERKNFFRVGTGNLRPRALKLLMTDGIVLMTAERKYYLDREKLNEMRKHIKETP